MSDPDQLAEIKNDLERGGDDAQWPAAAVRWLVGEVERLRDEIQRATG